MKLYNANFSPNALRVRAVAHDVLASAAQDGDDRLVSIQNPRLNP